jgi:hypothetical protein
MAYSSAPPPSSSTLSEKRWQDEQREGHKSHRSHDRARNATAAEAQTQAGQDAEHHNDDGQFVCDETGAFVNND